MTTSRELVAQANGLLSERRVAEAARCFRQAIALDPRSAAALVGLARLALMAGRLDEAPELLDRALALEPDHAEALAVLGIYWMEREEFERAIEVLEQAKASDAGLAMVYFNLGKSYCELGRFPRAEENFRQAIERNPGHFEAYSQLSYLQTQTGRVENSIHSMLEAIRINPRYVKGYLVLGALYERARKRDLVIRLYRSGIRQNPDAFPLRERLCSLYAVAQDFRSALREAIAIIKRRSLCSDYLRLGTYLVALGRFETAEKVFRTSIQLNPASWEGFYNLAELYMGARMRDQAREHYQAALEKNRSAYEPLNGMGLFVLMVDQDWDAAIALFQQAIQFAPSRPEPRLNLALAYAKKGDHPAAQRFAASVLTLTKPRDPVYRQAERLLGTIRIESQAFRALK